MMSCHEGEYISIRSADMLQSTMKEVAPERNPLFSETDDDRFEEMVRTSKLIPFLLLLIRCLQMRSAFRRGLEILSDAESGSVQSQGKPGKSVPKHIDGICGVPKNVAQLKPVFDKLMQKVIAIAI
jgi:hypothetical protein